MKRLYTIQGKYTFNMFKDYAYVHVAGVKKANEIGLWIAITLIGAAFVYTRSDGMLHVSRFMYGCGFTLLFLMCLVAYQVMNMTRGFKKWYRRNINDDEFFLEFFEDHFVVNNHRGKKSYPYHQINSMAETPQYFYLYFSKGGFKGQIVPKNPDDKDFDAFMNEKAAEYQIHRIEV